MSADELGGCAVGDSDEGTVAEAVGGDALAGTEADAEDVGTVHVVNLDGDVAVGDDGVGGDGDVGGVDVGDDVVDAGGLVRALELDGNAAVTYGTGDYHFYRVFNGDNVYRFVVKTLKRCVQCS